VEKGWDALLPLKTVFHGVRVVAPHMASRGAAAAS
jgi:hypothetical protein